MSVLSSDPRIATGDAIREPADLERPRTASSPAYRRIAVQIASAYAVLEAVTIAWGHWIGKHISIKLDAAPISGRFASGVDGFLAAWNGWAVVALCIGVLGALTLPRLARHASWTAVVSSGFVATVGWIVIVNANRGVHGLTDGVGSSNSYFASVPAVGTPHEFLRTFVTSVQHARYGIHVQGHPPGMVLVFWLLDRIGLGSIGGATALVIAGGGAAVVAVLVALRNVAGEQFARAAMPFLVLAPAAVWLGSAPDGFFAGVSASAIACVVLASSRSGRRSDAWAVAGAVLSGASIMLSYGLVLIAVPMVIVCAARRRARPLVIVTLCACSILAVVFIAGFSWFAGLAATRARYWDGVASRRPTSYFLFANIAALLVVIGPAIAIALGWLRDRKAWLLVGSGGAMALLADFSMMSKGETERIWLPFAVWILAAGGALWTGKYPHRIASRFLVVQVCATMLVQTAIRTSW